MRKLMVLAVMVASGCHRRDARQGAQPPAEAAGLVAYDLSPARESWQGWTAKGAPASKVIRRPKSTSARIHPTDDGAFDVEFDHGREDLDQLKEGLLMSEAAERGKVKVTIVAFTADELEWVREYADGSTHNKIWTYAHNYQVAGEPVSCRAWRVLEDSHKPLVATGLDGEAMGAAAKQACGSLTKQ